MQMTGAQIVIECLKEQGVDTVFGYPGGTILNIYDELYKHQGEIHHVLTSHEQGAAHAADGYARSTGKVGVCLATSGPGATNLVTGIATAQMDSIPVVAITCNVGLPLLGKDSFQEVDIAGVVMPITKHSFIVKDVAKLAKTIRRAFVIAKSGRPGPVLVDIPKDITAAVTEFKPYVPSPVKPYTVEIRQEDIDCAAEMIKESKRPFLFVGGGAVASGAWEEVRKLSHNLYIGSPGIGRREVFYPCAACKNINQSSYNAINTQCKNQRRDLKNGNAHSIYKANSRPHKNRRPNCSAYAPSVAEYGSSYGRAHSQGSSNGYVNLPRKNNKGNPNRQQGKHNRIIQTVQKAGWLPEIRIYQTYQKHQKDKK